MDNRRRTTISPTFETLTLIERLKLRALRNHETLSTTDVIEKAVENLYESTT